MEFYESPWMKLAIPKYEREPSLANRPHPFTELNWLCAHCNLMKEGHDKRQREIRAKSKATA